MSWRPIGDDKSGWRAPSRHGPTPEGDRGNVRRCANDGRGRRRDAQHLGHESSAGRAGDRDCRPARKGSRNSMIEGVRASGCAIQIWRHNDVQHLEQLLSRAAPDRPTLIVFESIYSMDGDVAPLAAICDLAERYGAMPISTKCMPLVCTGSAAQASTSGAAAHRRDRGNPCQGFRHAWGLYCRPLHGRRRPPFVCARLYLHDSLAARGSGGSDSIDRSSQDIGRRACRPIHRRGSHESGLAESRPSGAADRDPYRASHGRRSASMQAGERPPASPTWDLRPADQLSHRHQRHRAIADYANPGA